MNKVRISSRDIMFHRGASLLDFLPPKTIILAMDHDNETEEEILSVQYDFNWCVNRVSPRGDNIGSDFDFNI